MTDAPSRPKATHHANCVYGYHGTTGAFAANIIQRGFNPSCNDHDWLGRGIYFFQEAPLLAWKWAKRRHGKNVPLCVLRTKITIPDKYFLDLLDRRYSWCGVLRDGYRLMLQELEKLEQEPPPQKAFEVGDSLRNHPLDRYVIDYTIGYIESKCGIKILGVRSAFVWGDRVFKTSHIFEGQHIQIAIIDDSLITYDGVYTYND